MSKKWNEIKFGNDVLQLSDNQFKEYNENMQQMKDLKQICIDKDCKFRRQCKIKAKKPCPVYAFKNLRTDYVGSINKCPSCSLYLAINEVFSSGAFGNICGHCAYFFKMKGFPILQTIRSLKAKGLDKHSGTPWEMRVN